MKLLQVILVLLVALNVGVTISLALWWGNMQWDEKPEAWDFSTYNRMADDWLNSWKSGTWQDFHLYSGEVEHHFPPLWPILLAPFGFMQARLWAALAFNIIAMGLMVLITQSEYGEKNGLLMGILIFGIPYFAISNVDGFSDTFVSFTYAFTIAALLDSIRNPKMVMWAGAFAGMTYLLKASMGYFIILAGTGGVAWRLMFNGWRGIANPYYLKAVGIFALFALPWITRNILNFGWRGWETQPYMTQSLIMASHTPEFWNGLPTTVLTGFALLILPLAGFVMIHTLTQGWRPPRFQWNERTTLLIIAVILPLLIGCVTAAGFDWREGRAYNDGNLIRYVMPSVVPLLWLYLETVRDERTISP